jgi:hypothetical protein
MTQPHHGCKSIQIVRVYMRSLAVTSTQKLPSMGTFLTTQCKYFPRWSKLIITAAIRADLNFVA